MPLKRTVLACLALIFCLSSFLFASPKSSDEARKIVKGWLKYDAQPLKMKLPAKISDVQTCIDDSGQPIYYIVNLNPSGFVIVSADSEIEPIIGFLAQGKYDSSDNSPLTALVSGDMLSRNMALKEKTGPEYSAVRGKAKQKWSQLEAAADTVMLTSLPSVSDIRVSPLIQSQWDQMTVCGNHCYDYYTVFDSIYYPTGCVATAMAQLMKFYNYPDTAVGTGEFNIYVNNIPRPANLRGGNGAGGVYSWTNMPLLPDCSSSDTQRSAIGALCYDAGVAVHMQYAADGSGAFMSDARTALVNTFHFFNSVIGGNEIDNIGTGLNAMINPNLDAGFPVLLGIQGKSGTIIYGHAIVADGYGYSVSTLYHHLNMGWSGQDNAWYNLPNIDSNPSFNIVNSCIYNTYITGSGEIISGRITSLSGAGVSDVTVTAQASGTPLYTATTNSNGIYALAKVLPNKTYTVTASKAGYTFSPVSAPVGQSQNSHTTSGNVWGLNFVFTEPQPPAAQSAAVSGVSGSQSTISLSGTDDGLPNPPGRLQYIITSLPQHGNLSDPCQGVITAVQLPYTLINYGNDVNYLPCIYYSGTDNFSFKVNDGGTAPQGGDSNTANITIDVQPSSGTTTIYSTDFTGGLPAGWSIVDGYSDAKTWTSTNPKHRSSAYWSGTFMIVDSDWAGSSLMDEQLITGNINCSDYGQIKLNFSHYFYRYTNEIADVDVRVNGGAWQNVARYQNITNYGNKQIDISSIADHSSNVQVRWHYYNAQFDWYWGIDNVSLTAVSAAQPMTGDFGLDCRVDFDDMEILAYSWLATSTDTTWNAACDISQPQDNTINFSDFAVFSQNWLSSRY